MLCAAPRTALVVRPRLFQATAVPNPTAPPRSPNASDRPSDLFFPERPASRPRNNPSAAGGHAERVDAARNWLSGAPFRNASRPERTPCNPEFRMFRPCSTSDLDHVRIPIHKLSLLAAQENPTSVKHLSRAESTALVTTHCDLCQQQRPADPTPSSNGRSRASAMPKNKPRSMWARGWYTWL